MARLKLKDMIQCSEEYLKKQHDRWDNNVKLYRGEITRFRQRIVPQWAHVIEVNLTRPTIDAMLPNLIFKTPKINFRPGREIASIEQQQMALTIENDLNAIQLEIGLAQQYKIAVKDALLLGDGFVQYGLAETFDYDPVERPFASPFIKRRSPWETGIDPACREQDLSDAQYIWFRSIVPLYKARRDRTLKNPERLQPTSVSQFLPRHLREDYDSKRKMDAYEYTVLYDIWDRESNKLFVTDENGVIFQEREWPYQLNGDFPVVHIGFTTIPDEFYCPGEPEFLEMLQLEASEKRTQWLNHTRRFNRKYWVPPDMSDDDKKAFAQGDDGTIVTSREPPQPIADAPMPGDVSAELQMIMNEAREVSGISAYHRGGSERGVATATEASMIGSAANIRIEERRLVVADAIAKGAKILYNIMRPIKDWPMLPFDFTVDISTMRRPDDNEKRQDLMVFGQTGMQLPEFKRTNWLRDVALAFNKPPEQYVLSDQEIQQMQQAQAQAQAQQLNPEQVKAQTLQMEAQLRQQQMQVELQTKQAEAQMDLQYKQAEMQMKIQEMNAKMEIERAKLALEEEKLKIERQKILMQLQAEQEQMDMERQKAVMDIQTTEIKNKQKQEADKAFPAKPRGRTKAVK